MWCTLSGLWGGLLLTCCKSLLVCTVTPSDVMYPVRPANRLVNSGYLSQSSLDICRYGNCLFTEIKTSYINPFMPSWLFLILAKWKTGPGISVGWASALGNIVVNSILGRDIPKSLIRPSTGQDSQHEITLCVSCAILRFISIYFPYRSYISTYPAKTKSIKGFGDYVTLKTFTLLNC